jgi:hypothetical protein
MAIATTIDEKFGSLSKFAETVWENMDGVGHAKPEVVWAEVTRITKQLLGEDDGQLASDLLREQGFFSIVFPD